MFGLGTTELIVILVIIVMFFGAGKLPIVAKQLGSGLRGFQKSLHGDDDEEEQASKRIETKPSDVKQGEEVAKKDEKSENSVIF